jgi:hypothetical protein
VLWLRRVSYALIPALLSGVGLLWADRAEKITLLNKNTTAIHDVSVRVETLERRVEENKALATEDRKEILDEIKETRKEIRAMYLRASAR